MKGGKMKKLLFVVVLMFVAFSGCEKGIFTDPETGEQKEYRYIDPNKAAQYEVAVEGAVGLGAMLMPLLPWLAPFVTGGGGLLAMYKKLKPQLTASEKDKGNLVRGGTALAQVLEEIKVNYPDTWAHISPAIHDSMVASGEIETAVKEFRRSVSKVAGAVS